MRVIVNTCAVTAKRCGRPSRRSASCGASSPTRAIIVTGCAAQIEPRALRRHGRGRSRHRQCREDAGRNLSRARLRRQPRRQVQVNDIMSVRETAHAHGRRLWTAARAPSCRCRTAATIAAPSASSPMAAGRRARCRWARWSSRCERLVEATAIAEIVLTGVDITSYGADLPGATDARQAGAARSCAMCRTCRGCGCPRSIRSRPTTHLLDAIAEEPRLMPHLHLSLQSGDDMILKRMKRRHARADAIAFCEEVRRLRPDMVFGADLIAGFPTETEAMFENSLRHRRGMRADLPPRLSVLAAAGTPAARMPQVAGPAIKERAAGCAQKGERSSTPAICDVRSAARWSC